MTIAQHSLNHIRAIFFDAGGTLIHLDSDYICETIRTKLQVELSSDQFKRAQFAAMNRVAELVAEGAGSTEQLKRQFYSTLLPAVGVSGDKLTAAVEFALSLAQDEMLWRRAEEESAITLAQLKQRGLILGIVSNSDGRIESAFQQAGLAGFFDFFIDSFNVAVEKPDPRIFHLALESARVDPHEAAYVGDLYEVDVVGARNAGLIPILYDPFDLNRDVDCLTIRSISDLVTLVR